MKKIALVVAMLAFAVPAMAGTVTIGAVPIGTTGDVNITYASDVNLSAFGLDITVDAGADITAISNFHTGESISGSKGFGIFPGSIDINDTTGEVDSYGDPVAPGTDPCALGDIPGPGITIEIGALYEDGNAPDLTGTLCTVTVSADCNITVALNARRGNVVQEDSAEATTNLPITVPVTVVSLCTVPNVVGDANATAQVAITAAGLVASASYAHDCTVTAENVISQSPSGGAQVDCGSTVYIVVADGQTVVPSVVGQDSATATGNITAAGLVASATSVHDCSVAADTVTAQSPSGATTVACGSTVNIDVADGNTIMPDILGMTAADANAAIIAAGLAVGVIDHNNSCTVARGIVMAQDPPGGTEVPCNPSNGNYTKSSGCFPWADPNYQTWLDVNEPYCWCYPRQCHGDADDVESEYGEAPPIFPRPKAWVTVEDLAVLASGYKQAYGGDPDVDTWICADFNHRENEYGEAPPIFPRPKARITVEDLSILATYYKASVPANCPANCPK